MITTQIFTLTRNQRLATSNRLAALGSSDKKIKLPFVITFVSLILWRASIAEVIPPHPPEDTSPPTYIHITLTIFEVPREIAIDTFETTATIADHQAAMRKLLKSVDKDVSLVAQSRVPVRSGSRGKLTLTKKFDYPDITWAKDGTSFQIKQQKKEFGTVLEVEPVFSTDEHYIWLDYRLTHTPYMPKIHDVEIKLPEKQVMKPKVVSAYNREFASSVVIRNQASLLIGSFMIVDNDSDYRLIFLTVNLPESQAKSGKSRD